MKVEKGIIDKITEHSKRALPIEACGYLASSDGIIKAHYELTNTDESQEHFSFDPKEQFQTLKDARSKGLVLSGIYHSHPQTPARPSIEDIKLAYDSSLSYLIISLENNLTTVKSFIIRDSNIKEEEIEEV